MKHDRSKSLAGWGDAYLRRAMGVGSTPLSVRRDGKHRAPKRHDSFATVLACIAVVCFCLGALYGGTSGEQSAQAEQQLGLPVPFHLEHSVSKLGRNGDQERRMADVPGRKKIKLFVGIFTKPSSPTDKYGLRRKAVMDTFMKNITALPDVDVKFVVGRSPDKDYRKAFAQDYTQNPELYMHLDMEECYRCLPRKTASFFMAVHEQYDAEWVLKVDDDVYLNPGRLMLALEQWQVMGVDYVGCMKHGDVRQDPSHRWYEPNWPLLGDTNSLNAYGSVYALQQKTIADVIVPNIDKLRFLANEDTTVGQWMLAFNVTFFEDMRLCWPKCHPHAIAFLTTECQGLCNPEKDMYQLHKTFFCQRAVSNTSRLTFMKSYPGHEAFDSLKMYDQNVTVITGLLHGFHGLDKKKKHKKTKDKNKIFHVRPNKIVNSPP